MRTCHFVGFVMRRLIFQFILLSLAGHFFPFQPLYAKIKEIAWPKSAEKRNCEILQDGSVRITSQDEFGSLILTSHQRDFTVCYLSLLSQEKAKTRYKHDKVKNPVATNLTCKNSDSQSNSGNQSNHSSQSEKSHDSPRSNETKDDLNISPITQASCNDSPRALSNASGSPITPLDIVKDNEAKFRPFSTPTQELESEPVCTPFGKTAVFRDYDHKSKAEKVRFQNESSEHPKDNDSRKTHDTLTRASDCQKSKSKVAKDFVSRESTIKSSNSGSQNFDIRQSGDGYNAEQTVPKYRRGANSSAGSSNRSGQNETNSSVESCASQDSKPSPRCNYCWVTRHMSCDECPVMWSHVVKMARHVAENGPPADNPSMIFEPAREIMVLITLATSEGSGEPAHPHGLARAFAVRTHGEWK